MSGPMLAYSLEAVPDADVFMFEEMALPAVVAQVAASIIYYTNPRVKPPLARAG